MAIEKSLDQAHNKLDGAITGLDKASRLERCERKLDRLLLLVEGVCERVGVTVGLFEDEPAASNSIQPPAPPAASALMQPPAQQEPAASYSMSAAATIPLPVLTLIPATPNQSQDQGQAGSSSSTHEPAAPSGAHLEDPAGSLDRAASVPPVDQPDKDAETLAAQDVDMPAAPDPALAAPEAALSIAPVAPAVGQQLAALDVPPPKKPRGRKKTPVPTGSDTLQVPERSTRSRSRSRSPSPLGETSGSKRKAEDASDEGETAPKKARA